MNAKNETKNMYARLRRRAEERLASYGWTAAIQSTNESYQLIHEQDVRLVELQVQNEELQEAAIALQESRDRYERLYEFAPVGYLTLTSGGLIAKINSTGASLLGMERKHILQMHFASFVTGEDGDNWHRYFINLKENAGRSVAEFALLRSDGTSIDVQVDCFRENAEADNSATRVPGACPQFHIALTNISAQKALERQQALRTDQLEQQVTERTGELAKAVANTRLFIRQAPVAIAMFDRDMIYLAASDRWVRDYGRGRTDLIGLSHYDVHRDQPSYWKTVHQRGLACETVKNDEELWIQADGSRHWLRWSVHPWMHPDGEIGGIIISVEDITQYKLAEQDQADAREHAEQANRAKSAFLANMSHEIRTPLHNILGLAQLLQREITDDKQRGRLNSLCSSSEHLLSVINDVLDMSKIESNRLLLDCCDFSIGQLLDRVILIVVESARDKGLDLVLDVEPSLRTTILRGDAARIRQVLINLLANAIKFTEHGSVTLSVACRNEEGAELSLQFAVKDTGIGIAPEDRVRLFSAFEQADNSISRKYGGTGLGLAISDRLVKKMGGEIRVDSQPGAGSTFSFEIRFPRGSHLPKDESTACSKRVKFNGSRVLVAEDHPLSRELIRQMLLDLGCDVELARNGNEALELANERLYDLILMDMQMPGLDGLAATQAIRRLPEHATTPILAVTANAFVEDKARCIRAGMNGHLSKPLTPAVLAKELSHWLAKSPDCRDDSVHGRNESDHDPGPSAGLDSRAILGDALDGPSRKFFLFEFLRLHSGDLAQVRAHVGEGNLEAARKVVHTVEGVSAMVGAFNVRRAFADLGAALRAGLDVIEIAARLGTCEVEMARLEVIGAQTAAGLLPIDRSAATVGLRAVA